MPNKKAKITTSLTPMLSVRNGAAAIEFYKKAFGAVLVNRFDTPEGMLVIAEMAIDSARFFVSDESPALGNVSPEKNNATTVRLELTIGDPDRFVNLAVAAGATIIFPLTDQDYGWRQGRIADPFGHQWIVGCPLEN